MARRNPSEDAASQAAIARDHLRAAMVRLARGDSAALEEIYAATHVKLYGICLRILGDRKEAEDALQDVYVNLWQRADRYDPDRASPISWLATFARNRAVDRLRVGRVRGGAVGIEEAAPLPDEAPLADDLLIDAERAARVHTCLGTLDDNAATNIRAAFFDGFTYAELASRADVPLGTMKSWIRRGLLRLRECLDKGE
ncbi:MAG: sigma-70 family RNA polymerase sigma factor [Erythrobacter sp.]|uniref:sigma-70 family RNA polymerase sigma factor n=1 Tax=Erythrobacter sp. HL-111 TaxID=1798193 RepID=UPI0006D9839E|nr:sigma-70 family RNA polymerase sigma factor [Erythrobacter sp. HL-111]KPP91246.1 MAG: RNA polymerase sigma-70 factor, ECF subfamily [Erythrobacteraceae bacterium HL-111]SDT07563.1 RNA polymerase sigma-70 factor, ECF subfamily [Erythrobacter sp. HL-111]